MAFQVTSQNPTRLLALGSYLQLMYGVTSLVAGTVTVTLPSSVTNIRAAFASSNTGANATAVTATTANTLTITGTGTDQVVWFAVVDGGV